MPRLFEFVVSILGLVILWPLLILIAVAIKVTSRGPVLFRQTRVGLSGAPFQLLKFRSMRGDREGTAVTVAGDQRVTAVGRLLRATKLDELPELWNIARGDMSFVGPRPEVPAFVDLNNTLWRQTLAVRPGLTDPVTLRLRDEEALMAELVRLHPSSAESPSGGADDIYRRVLLPWKLRGYINYLESRSAGSDLRVLLATLRAIVDPASVRPPSLDELTPD